MLLLRHAHSPAGDGNLQDFDRPLSEKGRKDASAIGSFVKNAGMVPDAVMSSPARRAKETTDLFCEVAGIEKSVICWEEDFYYGTSQYYLDAVQSFEAGNRIMLVGHNPLMEETLARFCSEGRQYIGRMPEGTVVCLEHPANEWNQIREGTARLVWMVTPELIQ